MASKIRPCFKLVKKLPFLLNQRHLVRRVKGLLRVQEVALVFQKDVHPGSRDTQNISRVLVDVFLEVEDLFIARVSGKDLGQVIRILKGLPVGIGSPPPSFQKAKAGLGRSPQDQVPGRGPGTPHRQRSVAKLSKPHGHRWPRELSPCCEEQDASIHRREPCSSWPAQDKCP